MPAPWREVRLELKKVLKTHVAENEKKNKNDNEKTRITKDL